MAESNTARELRNDEVSSARVCVCVCVCVCLCVVVVRCFFVCVIVSVHQFCLHVVLLVMNIIHYCNAAILALYICI